ncbi:hypothetical protein SRRS_06470 [Sporomusa rhizae]
MKICFGLFCLSIFDKFIIFLSLINDKNMINLFAAYEIANSLGFGMILAYFINVLHKRK